MLRRSKCRENHDPLSENILMIVKKLIEFCVKTREMGKRFRFCNLQFFLLMILTLVEEDYLEKFIASLAYMACCEFRNIEIYSDDRDWS